MLPKQDPLSLYLMKDLPIVTLYATYQWLTLSDHHLTLGLQSQIRLFRMYVKRGMKSILQSMYSMLSLCMPGNM